MTNLEDQAFNLRDRGRIYLDHNATTPVAKTLLPHIQKWLESWGNPSSIHATGRGPKAILRESRKTLAKALNCSPLEIVFTSGGSEANNFILRGVVERAHKENNPRKRILISAVEHPAVRVTAQKLAELFKLQLDIIPVNRDGELNLEAYENLLGDDVLLVSVMFANNETGHIFPIKEMAAKAHEHGALFHTDAVQCLGKLPVNFKEWGVNFATFSGHKFYALKGGGMAICKKGYSPDSLIYGGGQERHRRAGTENTLAIACMGQMAEQLDQQSTQEQRLTKLRDAMESEILKRIPEVRIIGADGNRLPGTTNMQIPGVDGESLLMNLDLEGFSVSTGAACSAGNPEPSPTLLAMGYSREEAQASLRLSLGWGNTEEEIQKFVEVLEKVVARLRSLENG